MVCFSININVKIFLCRRLVKEELKHVVGILLGRSPNFKNSYLRQYWSKYYKAYQFRILKESIKRFCKPWSLEKLGEDLKWPIIETSSENSSDWTHLSKTGISFSILVQIRWFQSRLTVNSEGYNFHEYLRAQFNLHVGLKWTLQSSSGRRRFWNCCCDDDQRWLHHVSRRSRHHKLRWKSSKGGD